MQIPEAAESWILAHVEAAGPIEVERQRPWSTVLRVPLADGACWFKACSPVQAFEPRLTAELFARWPDRVAEVIAYDEPRAWLLLADAGAPLGAFGNPPEAWLELLPRYAELQRDEAFHGDDHVAHGVPELPVSSLPTRFTELLSRDLPLESDEVAQLLAFMPTFERLCEELAGVGLPLTVQHDDLHMGNVYERDGRLRVLDWGDCSISHPFFSLVVTFRFLEERSGLQPDAPWLATLRDAFLEPWGERLAEVFDLALRVGRFAHAVSWGRMREFIPVDSRLPPDRAAFDVWFAHILRRAIAVT